MILGTILARRIPVMESASPEAAGVPNFIHAPPPARTLPNAAKRLQPTELQPQRIHTILFINNALSGLSPELRSPNYNK
jgi:hypothetical protein